MAGFRQHLTDVDSLLTYCSDLTAMLGITSAPHPGSAGTYELLWDTVGFEYGKLGSPIDSRYSFTLNGPRDGQGRVQALRVDVDQVSPATRILYLSYRNPVETWVQLLAGGGAVGTLMYLGAFLRDFGADRRIKRAAADAAEQDVRRKKTEGRVAESRADVAVAINEVLASAIHEALGPGSGDAVSVARSVATLDQLNAMARLSGVLVSVDDVTQIPAPTDRP